MSVFKIGRATITRIEETYQPIYTPAELFPAWTEAHLAEHAHWLAPDHYDPSSGKLKLSVHSWLLQIDGRKILIDACCGNHKSRPTRPWWNMLDTPWLDRLAAAGARPDEIDLVMCTHLHHDHLGWTTQLKNGRWEPTFANARYVFSKPEFDSSRNSTATLPLRRRSSGRFANASCRWSRQAAPILSAGHIASTNSSRSCRPPVTRLDISCSSSMPAASPRC